MKKQMFLVSALTLFVSAAQADIVVIGHPSAAPLSKEQVADVFLGKNTALTPVDQSEPAPIRATFYQAATGRDLAQIKATWSRLVFSGKARPIKEVGDATAVKQAVAGDPKLVGYIDAAAVDSTVKVLAKIE